MSKLRALLQAQLQQLLELVRIHRLQHGPIHFSPGPGHPPAGRYDSATGRFGVLYTTWQCSVYCQLLFVISPEKGWVRSPLPASVALIEGVAINWLYSSIKGGNFVFTVGGPWVRMYPYSCSNSE